MRNMVLRLIFRGFSTKSSLFGDAGSTITLGGDSSDTVAEIIPHASAPVLRIVLHKVLTGLTLEVWQERTKILQF